MIIPSIQETSVKDALERLRNAGSQIGLQALYAGIRSGAFPFGLYIPMDSGRDMYVVYVAQLNRWIEERSVDEEYPDEIYLPEGVKERRRDTDEAFGNSRAGDGDDNAS